MWFYPIDNLYLHQRVKNIGKELVQAGFELVHIILSDHLDSSIFVAFVFRHNIMVLTRTFSLSYNSTMKVKLKIRFFFMLYLLVFKLCL
jgi:hypothetical protein